MSKIGVIITGGLGGTAPLVITSGYTAATQSATSDFITFARRVGRR